MTSCCPSCVSWVLLVSHALLLGVGGVGVWVSANNFWNPGPLPPTPPPGIENTTITTTTTSDQYQDYYSRNEMVAKDYQEYIYEVAHFANVTRDARLYVMLPCVISVVEAALVLMGGLWSRKFFAFTFTLYSSLGLWTLVLTWIIIYQNVVAWNSRMNLDSVYWIVGFHGILMLILSVQILLCVLELRRQKAGWPTINLRSLFTAEALLMVARLTLTVYTILSMSSSEMIFGFEDSDDTPYKYPYDGTPLLIRYPPILTFVCLIAACYNAVATIETMLSMLLGKLQIHITAVTSLLSGLCCITIAVISSPVIIETTISPKYMYPHTMYFAIGLSVVTCLHATVCMCFPATSRSPPEILHKIIKRLASGISSLGNYMMNEQLFQSTPLPKKGKLNFIFNCISSIFTLLSIIIIPIVYNSPLYRAWGLVVLLCANSATLVRTLPPVVMELRFKLADNTPVNQKLMGIALENTALLVGAIAVFVRCYYGGEIFAGVVNLFFFAFQIFTAWVLVKGMSLAKESEEVKCLSESEEDASQGENDEQKPSDILA